MCKTTTAKIIKYIIMSYYADYDNFEKYESVYSCFRGGITLTVAGVRLDGMGKFLQTSFLCNGMSCEDNTTKVRGLT